MTRSCISQPDVRHVVRDGWHDADQREEGGEWSVASQGSVIGADRSESIRQRTISSRLICGLHDHENALAESVAPAWARIGTEVAEAIYKQRAATAAFPNAGNRNRGLQQFRLRGMIKAKAVSLLHALGHNFQRTLALGNPTQPPMT